MSNFYCHPGKAGGTLIVLNSASILKRLWKSTNLSSHEFANELAAFFGLRRMTLLQLTELRSFAPNFLRDASIFPFETSGGTLALAASDPVDAADG